MGERREVEPLVASAKDAQPPWFGSGLSAIRLDAGAVDARGHERFFRSLSLPAAEPALPSSPQRPDPASLHAAAEDAWVLLLGPPPGRHDRGGSPAAGKGRSGR